MENIEKPAILPTNNAITVINKSAFQGIVIPETLEDLIGVFFVDSNGVMTQGRYIGVQNLKKAIEIGCVELFGGGDISVSMYFKVCNGEDLYKPPSSANAGGCIFKKHP